MCLNCGCMLPNEDWDSPDNITVDTIKRATSTPKALGLSADEVIERIMHTWMRVKESDKNYRTGKKATNVGDIIDKLMDFGMNKKSAVTESKKVKDLLKE